MKTLLILLTAWMQITCCIIAKAEIDAGAPVRFTRDAFVYQNTVSSAPIVATAHAGELGTVRNVYYFKRDIRSYYDPVTNPNVLWADILLERTPTVYGSFPVDDGFAPELALAEVTPTGTFNYPVLLPSPTTIRPGDLITATISPSLSHHIRFTYDTQLRRSGTSDEFESVGGTQAPEFETGKSYNRFFRVPDWMTTGITSHLSVDMRTIISFGGVEIASREVIGAIVVLAPPLPVLELKNPHFNENGDFLATLSGAQTGKRYWVESSGDLINWRQRYSVVGTEDSQTIFLPISAHISQFYRVKAE
jgi:hypothetical protein